MDLNRLHSCQRALLRLILNALCMLFVIDPASTVLVNVLSGAVELSLALGRGILYALRVFVIVDPTGAILIDLFLGVRQLGHPIDGILDAFRPVLIIDFPALVFWIHATNILRHELQLSMRLALCSIMDLSLIDIRRPANIIIVLCLLLQLSLALGRVLDPCLVRSSDFVPDFGQVCR